MGVRFDTARLRVVGEPVVLLERFQPAEVVLTPLCVAGDGTMALVTTEGDLGSSRQELVWVDRSGQVELVDPGMTPVSMHVVNANHGWALSPDGTRVAIGLHTEAGDDVWVKQLPRGALTRVTFGPEAEFRPEWTPDGRSVLFITPAGVRVRRADGAGEESAVTNWPANEAQLSHDGQWLVARGGAGGRVPGGRDIVAMRVGQDSIPRPILASVEYDETAPMLSPDSRWLLYQSNESGRNEIYLRPFPDVDRLRVQVSVGGGETPLWSRDGREIFFVSADRRMMAATFAVGAPPTVAVPRALFALPAALLDVETAYHTPWDVAADGRFLMARSTRARADTRSEIILTHNYVSELRRRLPR